MSATEFIAPPCLSELGYVYQDEHLLLLEKPSGLLSVPGQNPLNSDSVLLRLKQRYPQARLVHRLDFGTSGLMIACLTDHAIAHINRQFQLRQVQKEYTAVLAGHLQDDDGVIDLPIARDVFPVQKICVETGKQAQSAYQVLARDVSSNGIPITRVHYKPLTGRTHQLRVHSKAIGHAILGCELYNAEVESNGRTVDTESLSERLLLHAGSLSFEHPESGERVVFESDCPF